MWRVAFVVQRFARGGERDQREAARRNRNCPLKRLATESIGYREYLRGWKSCRVIILKVAAPPRFLDTVKHDTNAAVLRERIAGRSVSAANSLRYG